MTLETLREFGANVDEGLARCMNNEAFYIKMVNMGIGDKRFESLKDTLENNDLDEAFEMAHALKGVVGNLALDPIYGPMNELTELLRSKTPGDYMGLYNQMKTQRDRLLAMAD
ncbi:MAG: Hpt domain-containing protein [Lachnospiraceae bacterium]|nr:Hpt domain-containing protein [Lachnospiraceae bacterium]